MIGKRVEYDYDSQVNLISVTDQNGAKTEFTYLINPNAYAHYLNTVIDPLGRAAAKTEFDEQGRIKKVIDADGKVIEYEFDTGSKIQKVKDQLGNVTVIENDDRGNVIREVSPEGAITLRTYDGNNNMLTETQVVIHNGVEIKLTTTYTYDADNNKLTETDARGNVTSYTYNKYGQILSTTSGGVTTYTHYNEQTGLPTTTTDVNGNTTRYTFDDRGNMTTLVNSNGVQLITSEYNKYGEVTSIASTNGRTTYMEYDNNGDCITTYYIENGYKILDKTIYDDARRVIGREHWIIQMGAGVQPLGGGTSNIAPPKLLWSTTTEYNAAGQVIREIDQNGLETEVRSQTKGSDGQIIWSIQRTVYDAAGRSTYSNSYTEGIPATQINGSHSEYDKDGRSIRSEQLLGLVIEIGANGQSFVKSIGTVLSSSSTIYNTAGWVLSSTDSYGLVTQYTYNVFGETTQTRRQLISGGWLVSETVYDSQGRVIFSTDSHLEGSTNPVYGTKSIYDSQGRSVGSIRYEGSKIDIAADGTSSIAVTGTEVYHTSTEYDTKGRVQSSIDVLGNITIYEYDNLDRQVIVKQANGLVSETVYDSQGRVWKSIVKASDDVRTTEYKYDMFSNIIETIQPDGTTIKAGYNDKGQKTSETNQLGQTRYFEYDDNGQLIKVTLPEVNGQSPVYEYTYDVQGNQLTIKDSNGNVTKFTYDDNDNQLTRTLPDGSTEYFEYDFKGRIIKQTSFEGVVTTYQYDSYDRLSTKIFTQNGINETWTYTYDSFGRVSEIDQNGRVTKTTYDSQGQTILIEMPEGSIAYTYDKYGNQAAVQTDNDPPTYYTYDRYGCLATVSYDNKTIYYEYDIWGNLAKEKLPNGVITTYEYDNMNRLIKLTNFADKNNNGIIDSGELVSKFGYTLDSQGRKIHADETFNVSGTEKTSKIDWTYDTAGRLIREVFDHYDDTLDQTQDWECDLVGNRTLQRLDKGNDGFDTITSYTYDVNDRLLEEILDDLTAANKDRITEYRYDHTQQTYKSVSENGVKLNETTFEYDAQGRMAIVMITTFAEDGTKTRIERTSYDYNTDGIRVSSLHEIDADADGNFETSKLTEYLNDPLNITGYSQVLKQTETNLETGEQANITYIIRRNKISQITVKNNTEQELYFTFDGHGSTRVLTDLAGAIVQLYAFDAYGNAMGFDPSVALTEFLYSGEQFDSKIGQQYLRQRYYDPATGRFNRLDPFFGNLDDPQSLHKYLYTHADPVNGIDPSGKFAIALCISIGSFAVRVGKEVGYLAVASTALYGAIGAGMGAGVYMALNQNPLIGAYNGALIGAGLRIAYLTHYSAGPTYAWYGVKKALWEGAESAVSRFILEFLWGWSQNNVNYQSALLKALDSFALGVWNASTSEFWWDRAKTDFGTTIVAGLDGIITSLYNDSFKTPPPTQQEMIENACVTAGIAIVTKLMSTTFKQEIDIEARLNIKEGLNALFRSIITILVGFEGKALAGILNCMIPE